MPELCHTMGLVIRARREKDVVLTVLTPDLGKITVIAKGARSLKGPQMALSQVFCYGDFELYRKGELYWLHTGELKENFYAISTRLDALNLAAYFCEVALAVSAQGEPCGELMRLLLNSFHFLANRTYPDPLIKGVFEWRIVQMQGLAPAVQACRGCGADLQEDFALDIAGGELYCGACRTRRETNLPLSQEQDAVRRAWVMLTPGAVQAIRFCLSTPQDRMMSFRLEDEVDQRDFTLAGEQFLQYHLDVDSTALHMYKQMAGNT